MEALKVGDIVKDPRGDVYYIVEVNHRLETAVVFSPVPGRHQPAVYRWEDLRKNQYES